MFLFLNIAKVFSAFQDFGEGNYGNKRSTETEIAAFLTDRSENIPYDPINVVEHALFENFAVNEDVERGVRQDTCFLSNKTQHLEEVAPGSIFTEEPATNCENPLNEPQRYSVFCESVDCYHESNLPHQEESIQASVRHKYITASSSHNVERNVTKKKKSKTRYSHLLGDATSTQNNEINSLDTSDPNVMPGNVYNYTCIPTQPHSTPNPVQYLPDNNFYPSSNDQIPQYSTFKENYSSAAISVVNSNDITSLDTSDPNFMTGIDDNNAFMPTQPLLTHNPEQYLPINNFYPSNSDQIAQHSTYDKNHPFIADTNTIPYRNVTFSSDEAGPSSAFGSQSNTSLFLYEPLSIHNPMHNLVAPNHFDGSDYQTVEPPSDTIFINDNIDKRDEQRNLTKVSSFEKFKHYIYKIERYLKLDEQPKIGELDKGPEKFYFSQYFKEPETPVFFKMEDKINEGIIEVYNLIKKFSDETFDKSKSIYFFQLSSNHAECEKIQDGKDTSIFNKKFYDSIIWKITQFAGSCPHNIISYDSATLEILLLTKEIQQKNNNFRGLSMLYAQLKIKKYYKASYLTLYYLIQVMSKILNDNYLKNNYLINICYECIIRLDFHKGSKSQKFDVNKLKSSTYNEVWIGLNAYDIIDSGKREHLSIQIFSSNVYQERSWKTKPILLKHIIVSLTIYMSNKIFDESEIYNATSRAEYDKILKAFSQKVFKVSSNEVDLLYTICKAINHYINKDDLSLLDEL